MFYENDYWGMNLIWWFLWFVLLFWLFATPYDIPGQRKKKDGPLDILKRRYANGEMTIADFEERKAVLESDLPVQDRL